MLKVFASSFAKSYFGGDFLANTFYNGISWAGIGAGREARGPENSATNKMWPEFGLPREIAALR